MTKSSVKKLFIFVILGLILLPGCQSKESVSGNKEKGDKVKVCTSFYTMYDFVNKIGGDKVEIVNLVPTGVEPHEWEPTPKDIAKIEAADVLVYNGAGMDSWADKAVKAVNKKDLIVVKASEGLELINSNSGDHKESGGDPHIWLDPLQAKKQMEIIEKALIKADETNKDYYENNFNVNSKKLDELDKQYRDAVAGFARKDIIVAHEAFGYLCRAYGLRQVAIEGLSAENEPTPARISEIVKFVKDNGVKVVFYEELISPKIAEVIANETGAKVDKLNPIESAGDDSSRGTEYFSIMAENLKALTSALK